MGIYVNPPNMSKEDFLSRFGRKVSHTEFMSFRDFGDKWPVCLVNNGPFKAAGCAYNVGEIEEFGNLNDKRQKEFYIVEKSALNEHGGVPATVTGGA